MPEKYNSDGSCSILSSKCLFVHRPKPGLDSSVADGAGGKNAFETFSSRENEDMFALAQQSISRPSEWL